MIGNVAAGPQVSITGLGCKVPDRVVTNDDLAKFVDTTDEWIVERTGIRERRVAADDQALSDIALPAARAALEQSGTPGADVDLIIVATVTPDMAFPSAGAILADELGADGSGGAQLYLPAGGSRAPASAETIAERKHYVQMNGREVFKFATRVLVSSAEKVLAECGKKIDDVDVYIPHQANVRIIDHAAEKLGIPKEKIVVNVERYGNTSSGSIPLALADAQADGRLQDGALVLMTGMGAGLTWGSGLIEWTTNGRK